MSILVLKRKSKLEKQNLHAYVIYKVLMLVLSSKLGVWIGF